MSHKTDKLWRVVGYLAVTRLIELLLASNGRCQPGSVNLEVTVIVKTVCSKDSVVNTVFESRLSNGKLLLESSKLGSPRGSKFWARDRPTRDLPRHQSVRLFLSTCRICWFKRRDQFSIQLKILKKKFENSNGSDRSHRSIGGAVSFREKFMIMNYNLWDGNLFWESLPRTIWIIKNASWKPSGW